MFTFGRADYGRLGLGESATERPTPTHVKALTAQRCNGIAAGGCVSFAWTDKGRQVYDYYYDDGGVFCWGIKITHFQNLPISPTQLCRSAFLCQYFEIIDVFVMQIVIFLFPVPCPLHSAILDSQ